MISWGDRPAGNRVRVVEPFAGFGFRTFALRPAYFSSPYIRTYSTPCSPLHTPRT